MKLTRADVVLLFRIATDIVDRLPRIRSTGSTYRRSEVERLAGLVRFSERFRDGYGEYGVACLTGAGWRRIAAESCRQAR